MSGQTTHEWSDYSHVQDLYADGHEMASHTVTHSHGTNFNEEKWANEVIGMAEMLVRYAGVNPKDITGMRAPFLAVGGDTMFRMLNRYGLMYDSSMSVPNPSWPYTLNYRIPHTCAVKPCPTESHPGMWEIPMTAIKDVRGGSCAMADGCFYEEDAASIQKIFTKNFLEHYTKKYSLKTFWSTTQNLRRHFPYFSIQLGFSTGNIAKMAFSNSSIPSWRYQTYIS